LAAADGDHPVDCLQTGLQRLVDGTAVHHARRRRLNGAELVCLDGTEPVQRLAQGIDDPADQRVAHGHFHDAPGAVNDVAFFHVVVRSQQHGPDVVFFQVEGHAVQASGKLQQFPGDHSLKTPDAGDTVTDHDDGTHVL